MNKIQNPGWDVIIEEANKVYSETKLIDETSRTLGISGWMVLEAVGFTDQWDFIFDD